MQGWGSCDSGSIPGTPTNEKFEVLFERYEGNPILTPEDWPYKSFIMAGKFLRAENGLAELREIV